MQAVTTLGFTFSIEKVRGSFINPPNKEDPYFVDLILKVIDQAKNAFQTGNYLALDALVKNSGCEVQTFNILALSRRNHLNQNFDSLSYELSQISITNSTQKLERIAQVYLNFELSYIIQSRLLTLIKVLEEKEGYKTRDIEDLKVLNFTVGKTSRKLMEFTRTHVSRASIECLRQALHIHLGNDQNPDNLLIKQMFVERNLHPFEGKMYSCCFYNTKALLHLSVGVPFVIRRFTRKGEDSLLTVFLQKVPGDRYEPLRSEEIYKRDPLESVIVCEAHIPLSLGREGIINLVNRKGLETLILATATQSKHQYNKKREVDEPAAILEIKKNQEIAKELGVKKGNSPIPFDIEHFFCNTLRKELERNEHE